LKNQISFVIQIRQSTQNRKSQLENVSIDWNLSQDEAGSIDLSDEDMTVIENTVVNLGRKEIKSRFELIDILIDVEWNSDS
jgi:hypothetical protein